MTFFIGMGIIIKFIWNFYTENLYGKILHGKKSHVKFIWNFTKKIPNSQRNLKNINEVITLPDFK